MAILKDTIVQGDLNVTGTVTATSMTQTSDLNKKDIVAELDLGKCYELLNTCSTVIYVLKDDPDSKEQIGLIALEILQIFPELVEENKGVLSLNYSRLVVILLRLLKDLNTRVKNLENS